MAVCGVACGLWGLWLLLHSLSTDALIRLPLWLGGAVLVDDFLLIPLAIGAGWLLTRWTTVRATLLYVGVTTLIAIPLLLRQGKGVNPTVLSRNYLRDWLVLEATIVLVGVLALVIRLRRADGSAGSSHRRDEQP
ncbi:hypothetical protein EV646_113116 [Kribbella antiqua]|uniref:Uncharacterized protein n=2 Tax=Kribbella antiqua TaxID=2512217 RepID=A0A4R2ID44_9ACTN|nr:hypothetical protein EV646_113116 [Kribbella antiqua]